MFTTTGETATSQPKPSNDGSSLASCTSNGKVVAVGAGVGVPLGTLLAVALAGLVFFRRKQQKLQRQLDDPQGFRPGPIWEQEGKNSGLVSSSQDPVEAASGSVVAMDPVEAASRSVAAMDASR